MTAETPDAAPEELLNDNWATRAEAAATAGEYRAAIRFQYRLLLQHLAGAGLIQYEAQKSDAAYARELRPTPQSSSFRALLRQYERVWFGGYQVQAEAYAAFRTDIQELLRHLPA